MSEMTEAPASKAELLERMRAGRAAWDALIGQMPETALTQPVMNGGWSVKDVLAHVAAYEKWTAAQIRAANEGRAPTNLELYGVEELPSDSGSWDLDGQNAAIYEHYKDVPLPEVQALSRKVFDELTAAIEGASEEDLAKPGTPTWVTETSLLAAIPGQSYGHYAQHLDDLRALLARDHT